MDCRLLVCSGRVRDSAGPAVIAVLTGASSEEQIAANARAASWKLNEEELAEIRSIIE